MGKFDQRTAIVTGAACGIGFEIARRLGAAGAAVVINDIDAGQLNVAKQKLQQQSINVHAVAGSSAELSIIDELVETAMHQYGRLDYALANAGITTFGSFLDYRAEDFEQLISVNLRGSFFLAQRAAKAMIATHKPTDRTLAGKILLMSSITGVQHHPGLAAYGMTKAALRMLARSLAIELAPHSIAAYAIAPGATSTERTTSDPAYEATWSALNPTGRASTTTDIADTALFLLSDSGDQMSGQTLIVDGAWSLYSPPPDNI